MQLLPVWFLYLAAAIRLFGGVAYVRATLRGRAKPHAVSWLIWSISPLIAFAASLSAGIGVDAVITLALGLSPLMVFMAARHKDRRLLQLRRFDKICIAIALCGLAIWAITNEPTTAIIIAITADLISCLPTIRKTIAKPQTEYPFTFLLSASAMVIAMLATQEVSFASFAFPVYVFVMNIFLCILAFRDMRRSRRKRK